jgi:hypothetical protein
MMPRSCADVVDANCERGFVVNAQVGQAYVTTLDGKLTERGAVAAKLPAPGPLNGPIVAPFIRANIPAEVSHMSPLLGVVGATPGGTLKPELSAVDGAVISGPANVHPVTMQGAAPR